MTAQDGGGRVQRYGEGYRRIEPMDKGEYVEYDDYAAVEQERDALRVRVGVLEAFQRRVVEAHTGEFIDGCDMRTAEIEAIDQAMRPVGGVG